MRQKVCRVSAATLALTLAGSFGPGQDAVAQVEGPLVVILAGQSNMVGQGATEDLASDLTILPENVSYYLSGEEARLADRPRFGPEVTLARELAAAVPDREVILVKHAVGGTSLLAWAPEWDSTRAAITGNAGAGPLYRQLIDMVDGLGLDPRAELGAVLWMQGERDARSFEAGPGYFENLVGLIEAFRRDLDSPDLPFILGLVNPPGERYPATQDVREAQVRASRDVPRVYLVDTDDLSKWDDDLHYDSRGILELGRRFASEVLKARAAG